MPPASVLPVDQLYTASRHASHRRLLNMIKQHGQSDSMGPFNYSGSCHGAKGRYINGGRNADYEVVQLECLAMKVAAVCWALSMGYDKMIFKSDSELLKLVLRHIEFF